MRQIFRGSRYANVTATLALVASLGGTAYAANSIRSRDIVDGQVRRADLADGAVTSSKVRNNTLLRKDFKTGQLPRGRTGPPGPPGPKGDAGAPAPLAPSAASTISGRPADLTSSGTGGAIVLSATIAIGQTSRLVATAGAELSSDGGNNDQGFCYLRDGAGDMGVRLTAEVPASRTDISPVGAAVHPPGSYEVQLICGANAGSVTFEEATLHVIGAAP
jgi:hypothetical protein